MNILDPKLTEAVEKGFARQVILADEEGLVLESVGDAFSPEVLVGEFLSAEPAIVTLREKLNMDSPCRFTLSLEGADLTVSGARIPGENETPGFLVIVVVPSGNSHRLVSSHVVHSFSSYLRKRSQVS